MRPMSCLVTLKCNKPKLKKKKKKMNDDMKRIH